MGSANGDVQYQAIRCTKVFHWKVLSLGMRLQERARVLLGVRMQSTTIDLS